MHTNNAANIPCEILYRPTDERFSESIRRFQGCPTIAATPGGRLYLGWYSGGVREPHMDNYNLLIYSDDHGKTWSEPLIVIPSSRENLVHALDIQLWTDPEGALHVFWVQNNTLPDTEKVPSAKEGQPLVVIDGFIFSDFDHSEWEMICKDPDAENPVFSRPRRLDKGFLRCKPLVIKNGAWLNFNYDQTDGRYGYSISEDRGKTYVRRYGQKKLSTNFDEAMAYQMENGAIRMLARTSLGKLAESVSEDDGLTWSSAVPSSITGADTRFFIARTPTGRLLLIHNDHENLRTNMTLALSEDDGKTWKYSRCIDTREDISYPDADFFGGRIYFTYDRERCGAKEILFGSVTEDDIMDPESEITVSIVSKP